MASPSTHPLAPIWPPARLRITTPSLELRMPTDEEVVELTRIAATGVHDPAEMPFAYPWTDYPPTVMERSAAQVHAATRGKFTTDDWALMLAAIVDGSPVGVIDVRASRFAIRREVGTGSWIAGSHQGRGLGTEMREGVLHLVFAELGALAANSGAWEDNPASARVSEKAGYVRNGARTLVRLRGPLAPGGESSERTIEQVFRIDRATWTQRRRDDITISGLDDDLREMLGAHVSVDD